MKSTIGDPSQNLGREAFSQLVEKHGFTGDAPNLFKQVDSQHAFCVRISRWDGRPEGGDNSFVLGLGVARRDNNQLRDVLLPGWGDWGKTLIETSPPFIEECPRPNFSYMLNSIEEIGQWADLWIPRLVDETTNLPFIKAKLDEYKTDIGFTIFPRLVEAMLDGWNDEAEEEFMDGHFLRQLGEDWKDDPDRSIRQGRLDRVREWIAEHPDGIERELTS